MVVFTRTTNGKILYSDGSTMSGWSTQGGSWSSTSGYLRGTTSSTSWDQHIYQGAAANMVIEASVMSAADNGQCGVVGRRTSSTTYMGFWWHDNGNCWNIYKVVNGTPTNLGSNAPLNTGTWYEVKVVISGTSLSVTCAGTTQNATVTDISGSGAVALGVRYGTASADGRFDWVKAYLSETITVTGLANGQKFKLYNGGGSEVATSSAASGGQATLSISSLSSRPPYQKIAVTDTDGSTIKWTMDSGHSAYNDIWGGDVFEYKTTVTLATNPSGQGLQVRLDSGTWYTAPKTYDYTPYSGSHTIEAEDSREVVTGQKRYVWASWSDSGARSHSISWPTGDATYTANYTLQWYFDVVSAHDSPTGEGWYNNGATASSSVTTPVTESGTIWECTGYTGTGSCPASGSGSSVQFTITAYSTCTWNWRARVYADRGLSVNVEKLKWLDRSLLLNIEKTTWVDRNVSLNAQKQEWLDRSVFVEVEAFTYFEDRDLNVNVEKLEWLDRSLELHIYQIDFVDRFVEANVEKLGWQDRSILLDVEKLEWIDRNLLVDVEKLGFLDRILSANVVYPSWLDRSVLLAVEKLDWLDRDVEIDVEKTGWIDRNLLLDVEKTRWIDRAVYVNVRKTGFLDRDMSVSVERFGWIDRTFIVSVVYPAWLDRNLNLLIEKTGFSDRDISVDVYNYARVWLDRSVCLDVQRFGEPMLGAYHFPHPQRVELSWKRLVVRRDIAERSKDFRADLGGLGGQVLLTGFIHSDGWESERQSLEAKKDASAAQFDDGTGVKFNAVVYDVEFTREVTDPITGRKGVFYTIRLAEV